LTYNCIFHIYNRLTYFFIEGQKVCLCKSDHCENYISKSHKCERPSSSRTITVTLINTLPLQHPKSSCPPQAWFRVNQVTVKSLKFFCTAVNITARLLWIDFSICNIASLCSTIHFSRSVANLKRTTHSNSSNREFSTLVHMPLDSIQRFAHKPAQLMFPEASSHVNDM